MPEKKRNNRRYQISILISACLATQLAEAGAKRSRQRGRISEYFGTAGWGRCLVIDQNASRPIPGMRTKRPHTDRLPDRACHAHAESMQKIKNLHQSPGHARKSNHAEINSPPFCARASQRHCSRSHLRPRACTSRCGRDESGADLVGGR